MSVAHPPSRRSLPLPESGVVAAVSSLVLAGATGMLPALVAVALAIATVVALAAVRLLPLVAAARAAHRPALALLAATVGLVGAAATALPVVGPGHRAQVGAAGLLAVALLHTAALFLAVGSMAVDRTGWFREVVDASTLGVGLAVAAWLTLPAGAVAPAAATALVVGACGVAAALVTGATRGPCRPGVTLVRVGGSLTLLGLAAVVLFLAYRLPERAALVVTPLLSAGVLLTVTGARRLTHPAPARGWVLPPWPLVTAAVVLALLAGGWHRVRFGEVDRTTILLLGLAVIPPLALRDLAAAVDLRRYADRLAAEQARFRSLFSGGHELILLLDDALRVRWQSPAGSRLFFLDDRDLLDQPFPDLLHPQDATRAQAVLAAVRAGQRPGPLVARIRDGQGVWRDTESTLVDQRHVPAVGAVVVYLRDVGDRTRLERAVRQLAVSDLLTGLCNRHELRRALAARPAGPGRPATLLLVNLHGLTGINDGRGQQVGDQVLVEVARRLRATVGAADLVARLAGDEFAVVAEGSPAPTYALATRLLAVLTEPYPPTGAEVRLHVSIGLAEAAGVSADDLLRQADVARRRAAQLGRNRIEWYDAELEKQLIRRVDLERELPGAVARGELDLVYQPVLGLADRKPVGTEALLRWRSPLLGTVLPAELLPVAKDLGLVRELGQWVLERACRQLATWSSGDPARWMAVNVTVSELTAGDFVTRVAGVLDAYAIAADRLVVEVADADFHADLPTVTARLAGLRALGVRTALDDVQPGRTSLSRLCRLPLDLIKIDQAWAEPDRPLTEVLTLGHRLGLDVVAEALESSGQADRAHRAGCRFGQGFALSRPATAERVEAFLEEFPSPGTLA